MTSEETLDALRQLYADIYVQAGSMQTDADQWARHTGLNDPYMDGRADGAREICYRIRDHIGRARQT